MASDSLQSRCGTHTQFCQCDGPGMHLQCWRLQESRVKKGLVSLQVSHHPPISAAHAENDKWVYDIVSAPSTKFMGNSVEIYPVGTHLSLFFKAFECLLRHLVIFLQQWYHSSPSPCKAGTQFAARTVFCSPEACSGIKACASQNCVHALPAP